MGKKGSFQKLIHSYPLVLVDFSAEWCGPCQALKPVLKDVARELGDKVKIIQIDVDRNQELSRKMRIMAVPTLILFKNGELVWKQSGLMTRKELLSVLNRFIHDNSK